MVCEKVSDERTANRPCCSGYENSHTSFQFAEYLF
jgi:hypothetical protein